MGKSTKTHWNVLKAEYSNMWKAIEGRGGMLEELTMSIHKETGDCTSLTP